MDMRYAGSITFRSTPMPLRGGQVEGRVIWRQGGKSATWGTDLQVYWQKEASRRCRKLQEGVGAKMADFVSKFEPVHANAQRAL